MNLYPTLVIVIEELEIPSVSVANGVVLVIPNGIRLVGVTIIVYHQGQELDW